MPKSRSRRFLAVFITLWLAVFLSIPDDPLSLLLQYGAFALLGIIGAIFANATGAGGGVIFVPFFGQLGLQNETIVATSFAIQCFGMTAGAVSWFTWYWRNKTTDNTDPGFVPEEWQSLISVLLMTVPFSVAGIVFVQLMGWQSPSSLHATFGGFSVFLALAIFASIPLLRNTQFRHQLSVTDKLNLAIISLLGGGITAWLSVGVGELIAIYLIFKRFNVSFAIACAVILSAFSVWAGVMYHLLETGQIYWFIVMFAGPGAIVGGTLARYLVLYFSVTRLKLFFAGWVLLIGIASIPL